MIIVVAALEFNSEADRDRAVELTRDVQMATRVEEPGCRDYCFAADPSVSTRVQVYELWDDSDSLAAHFTHPNYAKTGQRAKRKLHSLQTRRRYEH